MPGVDVTDIVQQLGGPAALPEPAAPWLILELAATEAGQARRADYLALRREEFVHRQSLFARHDLDRADADPRCRTLVAVDVAGHVLGGVRLHPETDPDGAELGWWRGSRLVVAAGARDRGTIGAALVRAACACAHESGALRFDAHVQAGQAGFFARLGWITAGELSVAGAPHVLMRWPVGRFGALVAATKAPLGGLLADLLAQDRWRGDDGVPVPGSDTVACLDAITPSMVERDPEWAGWCGILVTAHDLAAMGAQPIGALDALGARDNAHAARILAGIRRAADAFSLPVLGGHTQLGVPAALSVTGLGRTDAPVPAGGGRAGDAVTLTADLQGGWRPGYGGRQWDSTTRRSRGELTAMLACVRETRPRAAKDVSIAGIVGTAGMLAEAGGTGVELDVARIPRPAGAALADWLTCFPGFAMLTVDDRQAGPIPAGAARSAACGRLTAQAGVWLRWPDGERTPALSGTGVSGLGAATPGAPDGPHETPEPERTR